MPLNNHLVKYKTNLKKDYTKIMIIIIMTIIKERYKQPIIIKWYCIVFVFYLL